MKMRKAVLALVIVGSTFAFAQRPLYKDPFAPVDLRVEDLLRRMTLEEQVAQLYFYYSRDTLAFDKDGNFVGVVDTSGLNAGVGGFGARQLFQGLSPLRRAQSPHPPGARPAGLPTPVSNPWDSRSSERGHGM